MAMVGGDHRFILHGRITIVFLKEARDIKLFDSVIKSVSYGK